MKTIRYLPVETLRPHPDNPRKELGDLTELADSIKTNGIYQNLTVIPAGGETYTVIIGHRRLAAAKLAGLTEVPCVVTEMDRREQLQTMLLENMQRSELTVYEQAQGFQMMLDLGCTVEEISEKSGFSRATVRKRVKMMELDQDTLRQVSERQLSLADFDRLAQIKDISARNRCLAEIGTRQFDQSVVMELRKQNLKQNIPIAKKLLKKSNAKEIKGNEAWGGGYDQIDRGIYLTDWDGKSTLLPEKVTGQLYYCLDTQSGLLRFYKERKKAPPVKKTATQVEREKRLAAAWAELDELAAVAYELRSAFVRNLWWKESNAEPVLRGALIGIVLNAVAYMGLDRKGAGDILGVDTSQCASPDMIAEVLAATVLVNGSDIIRLIYALFRDSAEENGATGYRKHDFPRFWRSARLAGLYLWLNLLGYEMSDDEKALMDGTHELFHRGDPPLEGKETEAV